MSEHEAPLVLTKAEPPGELLLHVRALIQRMDECAELFKLFVENKHSVGWLRDQLTVRVCLEVSDEWKLEQVRDACAYLSDEYDQIGHGIYLIDTQTGKAAAFLTEDDLYDPGLMNRESGDVAQGLKRIKPAKEVSLTLFNYRRDKDKEVLAALAKKLGTTTLLQEMGDPRLRMATRKGRSEIAKDLAGDDPQDLLRRSSGTTGMFMRHFQLVDELPALNADMFTLEGVATFKTSIGVQDPLTLNLGYSRLGTLRGTAPQGWVRAICLAMSEEVGNHSKIMPMDFEDVRPQDLEGADLWVADPDVCRPLTRISRKTKVVPVEGVDTFGLKGEAGYLQVPHEISVETREHAGKWTVISNLPFQMLVRKSQVEPLNLLGIPRAATVV